MSELGWVENRCWWQQTTTRKIVHLLAIDNFFFLLLPHIYCHRCWNSKSLIIRKKYRISVESFRLRHRPFFTFHKRYLMTLTTHEIPFSIFLWQATKHLWAFTSWSSDDIKILSFFLSPLLVDINNISKSSSSSANMFCPAGLLYFISITQKHFFFWDTIERVSSYIKD